MKASGSLKENHEFRRLYRQGACAVAPALVIYCRKNKLGRNRLGLVSSAKLGCAVVRNRCRRRLREMFRLHAHELRAGYDIMLVARGPSAGIPWRELRRQFLRLCRRLDLVKEKV